MDLLPASRGGLGCGRHAAPARRGQMDEALAQLAARTLQSLQPARIPVDVVKLVPRVNLLERARRLGREELVDERETLLEREPATQRHGVKALNVVHDLSEMCISRASAEEQAQSVFEWTHVAQVMLIAAPLGDLEGEEGVEAHERRLGDKLLLEELCQVDVGALDARRQNGEVAEGGTDTRARHGAEHAAKDGPDAALLVSPVDHLWWPSQFR